MCWAFDFQCTCLNHDNLCLFSGSLPIVKTVSAYMYDVYCHIHIIKCYFRLWSNALYFNFSKNSYVYQYYSENLSYLKRERLERETDKSEDRSEKEWEREILPHWFNFFFQFVSQINRHCANVFCYIFVYFI